MKQVPASPIYLVDFESASRKELKAKFSSRYAICDFDNAADAAIAIGNQIPALLICTDPHTVFVLRQLPGCTLLPALVLLDPGDVAQELWLLQQVPCVVVTRDSAETTLHLCIRHQLRQGQKPEPNEKEPDFLSPDPEEDGTFWNRNIRPAVPTTFFRRGLEMPQRNALAVAHY